MKRKVSRRHLSSGSHHPTQSHKYSYQGWQPTTDPRDSRGLACQQNQVFPAATRRLDCCSSCRIFRSVLIYSLFSLLIEMDCSQLTVPAVPTRASYCIPCFLYCCEHPLVQPV